MNQKVIPISLRLNKNKNWSSKWIVDTKEYSKFFHIDFNIRKYIQNVFNYKNLKLIKLIINKTSNNLNIIIFFYKRPSKNNLNIPLNKIINYLNFYSNCNTKIFIKQIQLKNLFIHKNIIFFLLRKNLFIHKNIKKMIYVFGYSLYTGNVDIISSYIKQRLEKKKHHKGIIKQFYNLLKQFYNLYSNFLGFKLQFQGRLNGKKRKNKLIFKEGKLPLNSLKYNINYSFQEFKTPSGICSIKVFLFLKKTTKKKELNEIFEKNLILKKKINFFLNKKKKNKKKYDNSKKNKISKII